MLWKDLPVGGKLAVGFGVVVALLTLVSLTGDLSLRRMSEAYDVALDRLGHAARFNSLETDHLEWAGELTQSLLSERVDLTAVTIEADHTQCAFGRWYYSEDREELEGEIPELAPLFEAMETPHMALHGSYQRMLALQDDTPDASNASDQAVRRIFFEQTEPQLATFRSLLDQVGAVLQQRTAEAQNEARTEAVESKAFIWSFTAVAIMLAVIMGTIIGVGVTRPLKRVVRAADRIADGDLDVTLPPHSRDEVGQLADSFGRMTASLKHLAKGMEDIADGDLGVAIIPHSDKDVMGRAMAAMVENLRTLTGQVRETIETVATTISQVSASTAELSSSSAETASSVSETTTTVEEVKQTATLANTKAKAVTENAQQALRRAGEGKRYTEDIIQGMAHIRERMDFIAHHIIKLSDKSRMIGDIIQAVNDLADQSNILAVNASIEASKAGEEGKGFAVVAREIRSLSEQSKQSTQRIRAILEDISKATSTAVMATEEGAKAVTKGEELSAKAGEVIVQLVQNAGKDAQAAAQIAASSHEELMGMEQVAQAMNAIKEATNQNLDSSTQLEDSLKALQTLMHELSEMMRRYRL